MAVLDPSLKSPPLWQIRLRLGDRVQVRGREGQPWKKGTVKDLVDGWCPGVQPDGSGSSFSFEQVQPLVIAQLYP